MKSGENPILVHDENAEAYIIGCLLTDNTVYSRISQYLNEDCFYNFKTRELWDVIQGMYADGTPVDIVTVCAELEKGKSQISPYDIAKYAGDVASTVNAEYHAARLLDLCRRRRMWVAGEELSKVGLSEEQELADAHKNALDAINGLFEQVDGVFTLSDALDSLNEMIKRNLEHKGITGTPTGFDRFDEKGGLQKSDLVIVAGETSMGKTSLALSMTRNALIGGAKIAFYSMEMTKEQLAARLLSAMTNIQANNILYGSSLSPLELEQLDTARGKLPSKNLFFDDRSTSSLDTILMSIRSMKMQSDIDGAVVDYLQILSVNTKGASREQLMGEAARRLKNIAKELNIWVVALSQLSRDSTNPEPNLNRLRDSGQIAEAADVVMLVYRPEYYNRSYPAPFDNQDEYPTDGTAMIDVAKGRNVGTFKFFLGFDKNTTSFFKSDRIGNYVEAPFIAPVDEPAPF